jgi:Nucleoside H+ symporter.
MLLGAALQITNGFANPFITQFGANEAFTDTFGVKHANILISISQMSETLCILLIPFFMKKLGIKKVMLIAMFAWVFRFGFFGIGNPEFPGVIWFILSMLVYGVAFDFFNISGSLYVNRKTDTKIRSSAQGLFMLMTNGLGATIGTLSAQAVVNKFTHPAQAIINGVSQGITAGNTPESWSTVWFIFAGYSLVVGLMFLILFKDPGKDELYNS